jgi:hypothetical protein
LIAQDAGLSLIHMALPQIAADLVQRRKSATLAQEQKSDCARLNDKSAQAAHGSRNCSA